MTVATGGRTWKVGLGLILLGIVLNPWIVGRVLTSDGSINDLRAVIAGLFVCSVLVLVGLQLLTHWVERVSFGRPVRVPRVATVVAIVAVLIGGTYWRVVSFRQLHHHTHLVPTGHDQVTQQQQQWADDFYRRSLAAALKHGWFDYDKAMSQGFQPDRINRTHYPNLQNMFDGAVLDPERPEWLIYYDLPGGGKALMGFMFFTNKLEDVGPTPAGSLAQWHYHPYETPRCAVNGIWTVSKTDEHGKCAEGIPVTRTPEMFHVWFIDHPLGRFSEMNVVPEYWQDDEFDLGTLHPIAVHFAIALFVIAVGLDFLAFVTRRPEYHKVAWVNLGLAVIAVLAAVTFGLSAETAAKPTHAAHQILDRHKLFAYSTLAAILVLWGWRYALRGVFPQRQGAVLYLALSLAGMGAVTAAGYYGGTLVYRDGVGVPALDQFTRARYWQMVRDVYLNPTDADVERISTPAPAVVPAAAPGSEHHHH